MDLYAVFVVSARTVHFLCAGGSSNVGLCAATFFGGVPSDVLLETIIAV